MKRIVGCIFVILSALMFFSCTRQQIIGKWDDNIKLSTKTVNLKSTLDSITIKTGGSWWWISSISVNDDHFFDFRNIDQTADHYTIQHDCYVLERRGKNSLFVKVQANPLAVKRIISVGLQAGDYFDGVTIIQKEK